mmetsp:Transcript_4227/g.26866  ORF Transcript_4227/g.26866 Transcript_4227/m.26866 type:complete len:215 (+) Transcript_4227:2551-3195(+)
MGHPSLLAAPVWNSTLGGTSHVDPPGLPARAAGLLPRFEESGCSFPWTKHTKVDAISSSRTPCWHHGARRVFLGVPLFKVTATRHARSLPCRPLPLGPAWAPEVSRRLPPLWVSRHACVVWAGWLCFLLWHALPPIRPAQTRTRPPRLSRHGYSSFPPSGAHRTPLFSWAPALLALGRIRVRSKRHFSWRSWRWRSIPTYGDLSHGWVACPSLA